jgi:hypothetical protein
MQAREYFIFERGDLAHFGFEHLLHVFCAETVEVAETDEARRRPVRVTAFDEADERWPEDFRGEKIVHALLLFADLAEGGLVWHG